MGLGGAACPPGDGRGKWGGRGEGGSCPPGKDGLGCGWALCETWMSGRAGMHDLLVRMGLGGMRALLERMGLGGAGSEQRSDSTFSQQPLSTRAVENVVGMETSKGLEE